MKISQQQQYKVLQCPQSLLSSSNPAVQNQDLVLVEG
jgi:hypothetical protein